MSDKLLSKEVDSALLAFFILYDIFVCLGSVLILIRRNKTPISQRGWVLSIIGCTLSSFGVLTGWIVVSPRFPDGLGCVFEVWISSFFFISWLITYPLRAKLLYLHTQWNMKKLRSKEENDKDFWFPKYAFLTSKKLNVSLYIGVILLNQLLVYLITLTNVADTNSQYCYPQVFYLQLGWAIFLVLAGLLGIYLLWNVQDAYSFKTELKVFLFVFPIGFGVYVITQVFATSYTFPPYTQFVILLICGVISSTITLYYPVIVSYKRLWVKSSSQTSLSEDLFNHCLKTPALLQSFKKYCLESWCVENLQFYLEVQEFKSSIEEGNGKGKAKLIIEQYIDPKALLLVNIDGIVQKEILENFNQGNITISMFEKAEQTVLQQMNQDTFTKFKLSGKLAQAWKDAGLGELVDDEREKSRKKKMEMEKEKEKKPEISQVGLELLRESMSND